MGVRPCYEDIFVESHTLKYYCLVYIEFGVYRWRWRTDYERLMLGFAVVGLQAWFCYVTLNLGSSSLEAIEDPQLPQMHNITKQGCLLNIQHHKTVCGVPFLLERSEIKWRANGNSCLDFSPEKKTTVTFHLSHLSFTIDFIKSVYILNIISIFNHLICFYFKEILGETSGTVLLRK